MAVSNEPWAPPGTPAPSPAGPGAGRHSAAGPGPGSAADLPPALRDYSRWVDLDGPLHYLDFGGPADGPTIVCVHGLDGSSLNWLALAPLLTGHCRVLAPDLAGHGLTTSAGRRTTVPANRELLHRFVESVPGAPVILMGNSMGGMISLLEASAAPDAVAGLILVTPALPFVPTRPDPGVTALLAAYATPVLGQVIAARRRRQSPEARVAGTLALTCADPARVAPDVVAAHVWLARWRGTSTEVLIRDSLSAARSVVGTSGHLFGVPYRRRIRAVTAPVLLVHGERDRLVPIAVARAAAKANPSWSMVTLADTGHVPQLEAPRDTADAVFAWLAAGGQDAARSASRPPAGTR